MELNFIKDKEINLDKDDLLGTKPYVDTLLDLIKKANTPFTIGLFGGWGTGKSSIVKTIKKKLNDDKSSKVEVFVYDAWKYSKDSFRRTFILNFKKEFGIKGTEELDSFYQEESKDKEINPQFNFKYFIGIFVFFILLIFIIPAISEEYSLDIRLELTIQTMISFVAIFLAFYKNAFTDYKITIKKPRIFAPEKFEGIFKEFVESIVGKKSIWKYVKEVIGLEKEIDKIVIVIDNIDRCHKDLAFELLLTVKSFLEQKNVIFVIPIDETELKKHIKKEGHDGNEFLRKLFNTTLTIKEFSEDDLFDFTKQLQTKHNLDLTDEVLSLISQEFSKSPRKIIQFLNVLQTEIKLAEEQEKKDSDGKSNFKEKLITKNIEFLVKILLIREEWSGIYEKLKENPYLLDDINKQIDDNDIKVIYSKDNKEEDVYLTDEQKRFFQSTRNISTDKIEIFFANKDAFPGIPDEVNKLVLTQDWKTIKTKYLEKNTFNLNELIKFIDYKYETEVEQRKLLRRSGVNIFSLIFKISEDSDYKKGFLGVFYGNRKELSKIRAKLNNKEISSVILSFNPKVLLNFINTNLQKNGRLLKETINIVNKEDEDNFELLKQFIESFKGNEVNLKKVSTKFSNLLKEYPSLYYDFEDVLKTPLAIGALIELNLLEEFINNLESDPDTKDVEDKVEIINKYNFSKGLSEKLLKQFAEKIIEFLNSTNDLKIMSFWFEQLSPLIRSIKNKTLEDNVFTTLNQKNTFLWQQYNTQWNTESYQIALQHFLGTANEFYLLSKASKSEIETWLNNFFSRNESPELTIKISKLYEKTIEHFETFDWSFSQQLMDKFNQLSELEDKKEIANTLNLMLSKTTNEKGLNESQIQVILKYYIDNVNNDECVKEWFLSAIKNSIIRGQLKEVIEGLSIDEKLNILEIIKEIDKGLLKECIEEIIAEADSDNLEDIFGKLNSADIEKTLIKGGIKAVLKDFNKENSINGYLELFINSIIQHKLVDKTISNTLASKIKPMLTSSKKEDLVFAVRILAEIDISNPKKKKAIRVLLDDLDTSEFNEEEKKLYDRLKKKKQI